MHHDVELLRDLLFELEMRQTSPRSTVVISIDEQAIALETSADAIESSLADLLDLEYIEGPGQDLPGFFLFRRLTAKGTQFVRAMRDPRAWDRLKHHFAQRRLEDNL